MKKSFAASGKPGKKKGSVMDDESDDSMNF